LKCTLGVNHRLHTKNYELAQAFKTNLIHSKVQYRYDVGKVVIQQFAQLVLE